MNLTGVKLWQVLIFYTIILVVFTWNRVIQILELLFTYVSLLFTDNNSAINQFSFSLLDHFLSPVILLLIVFAVIIPAIRKKISFRINSSVIILLLLLFPIIFAPLVSNINPDFQKNLSVTKLLPPFTTKPVINLKSEMRSSQSGFERFINLKNKTIKEPFDDKIVFADSVIINQSGIEYYQGIEKNEVSMDKIQILKGKPNITSKLFPLGTDEYGRDILTRIIYGGRISLFVGFGSVLLAFLIGITFAFISSQSGRAINIILSRMADLFLSFPTIFLIVLILAFMGNNLWSVIIVLGLSGWMSLFKVAKTEISSVLKKDYIISAKLLGLKRYELLTKEILPVIIIPLVVNLVFQFSNVILAESALSYLGLGTGTDYPSWGSMIESGQEYLNESAWLFIIPGVVLLVTLLIINDIGRKINKYFNPKLND